MKIQFESSTSCNARCTFCQRDRLTRPKGEMSDWLFHKIIKEGKEMGCTLFLPFLIGEPFVFPRIWEWLDYLKDEEVSVRLYTNAEFMDVDRLIRYPNVAYVCCGINAATKETYDKLVRGPKYETVVKNTKNLIKKAPFRVRVSMVVVGANHHEQVVFKKIWGKRTKFNVFRNWTGEKHDKLEKKGRRVPCKRLLNTIDILWDGRVVPCCMDYDGKLILGDANKQTLKEIWEQSAWMKKRHLEGDFSMIPCQNCNRNVRKNE